MTPYAFRWAMIPGLSLVAGCSTMYDAAGKTPLGGGGPHVYGGVRTIFSGGGFVGDYSKAAGPLACLGSVGGDSRWQAVLAGAVVAPILADLSFSFVTDTLLLPCTFSAHPRRGPEEASPEIRSYERPPFRP